MWRLAMPYFLGLFFILICSMLNAQNRSNIQDASSQSIPFSGWVFDVRRGAVIVDLTKDSKNNNESPVFMSEVITSDQKLWSELQRYNPELAKQIDTYQKNQIMQGYSLVSHDSNIGTGRPESSRQSNTATTYQGPIASKRYSGWSQIEPLDSQSLRQANRPHAACRRPYPGERTWAKHGPKSPELDEVDIKKFYQQKMLEEKTQINALYQKEMLKVAGKLSFSTKHSTIKEPSSTDAIARNSLEQTQKQSTSSESQNTAQKPQAEPIADSSSSAAEAGKKSESLVLVGTAALSTKVAQETAKKGLSSSIQSIGSNIKAFLAPAAHKIKNVALAGTKKTVEVVSSMSWQSKLAIGIAVGAGAGAKIAYDRFYATAARIKPAASAHNLKPIENNNLKKENPASQKQDFSSYAKTYDQALEQLGKMKNELDRLGLAHESIEHFTQALKKASLVKKQEIESIAGSSKELLMEEVKKSLDRAFSGLKSVSSEVKEKFVDAYKNFRLQPTNTTIRDFVMAGIAIMLAEFPGSYLLIEAVATQVAIIVTEEIAAIGTRAFVQGVRNVQRAPITCSWEPIAQEAEASLAAQHQVVQQAPSAVRTITNTSTTFQPPAVVAQPSFQPPAVVQPSMMTAHAQAIQSGANTVSSAASVVAKVNQTSEAILRKGYYEVNGFKFSERYYNRLWMSGRKAPSLIAREILENPSVYVLPDSKVGFLRYEIEGWEMIYNQATKEVWHLQPIKN
jgi:hypothetical protein